MNPMPEDAHLLRQFQAERSEGAFRELVERHLPLVWSTARRVVNGDAAMAEDVAQCVFRDLAGKARSLPSDVLLGGWLHRHTFFTATKAVRTEARRRAREKHAAAMHDEFSLDDRWSELAPHLDAALEKLSRADREAIILRFFERRSMRDVGMVLGSSEEATRKRVTRALEKLRRDLSRRGIAVAATMLGTLIARHAVAPVPAALFGTVAGSAWQAGAAGASGGVFAALWARVATATGAAITATTIVVASGVFLWWNATHNAATSQRSRRATVNDASRSPPSALPPGIPFRTQVSLFRMSDKEAARWLLRRRDSASDAAVFEQLKAGGGKLEGDFTLATPSGRLVSGGKSEPFEYAAEFAYDNTGREHATAFVDYDVGTEIKARVRMIEAANQAHLDLHARTPDGDLPHAGPRTGRRHVIRGGGVGRARWEYCVELRTDLSPSASRTPDG
ncbi:MAG: RNA polymerase sigma factor [Verrucomicrobiales bacterium]